MREEVRTASGRSFFSSVSVWSWCIAVVLQADLCHPLAAFPLKQRRQQQEFLKLQQQQALQMALQPQAKLPGWGGVAKQPATKSLLEIQREEAQQMKQRKEQQPQQHPTVTQQARTQTRTVRRIFLMC